MPTLIAAMVIVIISSGIPNSPMDPSTTLTESMLGKIAINAIFNDQNSTPNIIIIAANTTPIVAICDKLQ